MSKLEGFYRESKPKLLPDSVVRVYQEIVVDLERSSGIMVEDGCCEFMFVKHNGVLLRISGLPPIEVPKIFSIEKITKPYKFSFPGKIELFTIKLQPWVSHHFFPQNLLNCVSDLQNSYEGKINKLWGDLFASTSFEEKVDFAEKFLLNIKMPERRDYSLPMKICEEIYRANGMISVKALMEKFPGSRQKINRDFTVSTKFSIKEFAILIKLREAIRFKHQNPEESFTDIALEFGYFDQSHFIKDIKRITSVTPGSLFSIPSLVKEQILDSPSRS